MYAAAWAGTRGVQALDLQQQTFAQVARADAGGSSPFVSAAWTSAAGTRRVRHHLRQVGVQEHARRDTRSSIPGYGGAVPVTRELQAQVVGQAGAVLRVRASGHGRRGGRALQIADIIRHLQRGSRPAPPEPARAGAQLEDLASQNDEGCTSLPQTRFHGQPRGQGDHENLPNSRKRTGASCRYIGRAARRGLSSTSCSLWAPGGVRMPPGGIETESTEPQQPPHLLMLSAATRSALVGRACGSRVGEALQPDRGHPAAAKGDEVAPARCRLGHTGRPSPAALAASPAARRSPRRRTGGRVWPPRPTMSTHTMASGKRRSPDPRTPWSPPTIGGGACSFGAEEDDLEAEGRSAAASRRASSSVTATPEALSLVLVQPARHFVSTCAPIRIRRGWPGWRRSPLTLPLHVIPEFAQGNALLQPCLVAQLPEAAQGGGGAALAAGAGRTGAITSARSCAVARTRATSKSGRRPAAGQPGAHRLPGRGTSRDRGSRCAQG